MTIVVSWLSDEREFPTLWTVADSRLSKPNTVEPAALLECVAKIFSLRIACVGPNKKGYFSDDVYFSTTIGMAFAGSSLLALNLYAFISYTLGNMASVHGEIPSLEDIAEHVNVVFQEQLGSFIDTNMSSAPCEVSIFGFCPVNEQHRLFHIKHEAKGPRIEFSEFKLQKRGAIHTMGSHQTEIKERILAERRKVPRSRASEYWRSPKTTIERVIDEKLYPDIGGRLQLGIGYPTGFRPTLIYHRSSPFMVKQTTSLSHQGINLYDNPGLGNVGKCFVNNSSVPSADSGRFRV